MTESEPLIDAEQAAFMQSGVSIALASRNAQNIPSVVRGLGCWVAEDRSTVKVFLNRHQGAALLADIAAHGAIAVVFNEPSTLRTIQLKGARATIVACAEQDVPITDAHHRQFATEVLPLGFSEVFTRTLFECPLPAIAAVVFAPVAAFSQTPGPHAGQPLRAGA